jgi:hypothetical protein
MPRSFDQLHQQSHSRFQLIIHLNISSIQFCSIDLNGLPMDARPPSRALLRLLAWYPHRPKTGPCRACMVQTSHSRRTIFGGVFDQYLYPKTEEEAKNKQPWRKRDHSLPQETLLRYKKTFPIVTSESLRMRMGRPRKVQMLMRDFVEGI